MSEIKVDTVAEKTSANGVTIDGLNIKDSKLVTANSVITSNITDDAVTAAKINNDIISGSTELASEPSDTDEFLVSDNGTIKRIDYSLIKATSPGMTLLTSGDITSTTSSIEITGTHVTSTYDHYQMWVRGKCAGDGVNFVIRYRNSSNNGLISSGYSWRTGRIADNGGGSNSDSDNDILLTTPAFGNNSNEGFNMVLNFMSPLSNLVPTSVHWTINGAGTSDNFQAQHGMGRRNDGTETHTGFTLFFGSGGDFANGTNYELYGLKIMTRYKSVDGIRTECTAEEVAWLDSLKTAWDSKAFDRAIAGLRSKRNQLLTETDWMANSDVTMSDNWKTYRQALRDLPSGLDTVEKVNAKEFPTKPGE